MSAIVTGQAAEFGARFCSELAGVRGQTIVIAYYSDPAEGISGSRQSYGLWRTLLDGAKASVAELDDLRENALPTTINGFWTLRILMVNNAGIKSR